MMSLFKNIFNGKIDDMDIINILSNLDWDLNSQQDRLDLVNKLFKENDIFTEYFTKVYDCHLSSDDLLTEDLFITKVLNIVSDYLLMDNIKDKQNNTFVLVDEDNYYKSNDIVVTKSDFKNNEWGGVLTDYQNFKDAVRQSELTKQKQDRIVGEITKDMTIVKEELQRPITPNATGGGMEPISWLEMDYTNIEQVKLLLRIKPKSIFSDLGILTYDLQKALDELNLSKSEKKIIELVRNSNTHTLEDAARDAKCSRQYVDRVLTSIAKKIVEAKNIF